MRIWVTGFGGFIGSHLVARLQDQGEEILASFFRPTLGIGPGPGTQVRECDVRDRGAVDRILAEFRPVRIFHLAAQSFPTVSWDDPWYTIETNVLGTINIFEGIRRLGLDCKVLNACSSAQYGLVSEQEIPVEESRTFRPLQPYGVSKVAQEMLAYQYFKNFGVPSVSMRIFNTTGPGKTGDVCSDLTKRIIEIERGPSSPKELRVGNLDSRRAITDVRDVVKAFDLAMDRAPVGEAYNLSGRTVYAIREIVEILRGLVRFDFVLRQDPQLLRPTDEPVIYGNSGKFERATGWRPEIPLEATLRDMLDYWRRTL